MSGVRIDTLPHAARVVARVCTRRREIQAAYVFGSVARGRTRQDSDIDIAVLLRQSHAAHASRYRPDLVATLGAALRRDDVQLVILNEAPPLLAHRVLSLGVLVFERSRSARVRFQVETARRHADIVPAIERYIEHLKTQTRGMAGG
jgi:predicted nucleotidyltransferase